MTDTPANPIIVGLLFILRCMVPLLLLLGFSYLLRRLGLVADTTRPEADKKPAGKKPRTRKGGSAHG